VNEKTKYIFDILAKARIPISYMAQMSKTSRTSLHSWKRGGSDPDPLRLNLAINIARRAELALDQGLLPLRKDSGLTASEKFAAVRRIIGEMGG